MINNYCQIKGLNRENTILKGMPLRSCYLVDTKESRFLVDCGLFQGSRELRERNYASFMFDPATIDFLILSHAHIDHSGMIPKLYRHGFRGPIYSTAATADLCEVMLPDSAHIQEMEVERIRRRISGPLPRNQSIYTIKDAEDCLKLFRRADYAETMAITELQCVSGCGHILSFLLN